MERVGGIGTNMRPSLWSIAAFALVLALGISLSLIWFAADGDDHSVVWAGLFAALLIASAALAAAIQARGHGRQAQMNEALREVRGRLQCLDELLEVWQWRTDAAHRIVEVRPPRGASNPDWRCSDAGECLWEFFRVDDEAALRSQLANGAPLDDIAVQRADGDTPRHGVLRARPYVDAAGGFAGHQGVVRLLGAESPAAAIPVAAPIPAAAPIPVAESAPEQESFSYTVSHDLRAPIRVVEGFTKIIKEDYGRLLDRVGNDHLDRVLGAAARMNHMIDSLLALSKLASQPLAQQTVNLSQLATYVADDLRRQWPDRKVALVIEPGMQLSGDPTLLRVVLENLLGNAWKYTAKQAQAQVWFERTPNAVDTYTVRDNGAGFDMRFADRLFGVFQRLHSANDFPGTGIGLASVRRIVRRHGGEIWGEGEVNRGARFHFSLPQVPPRGPLRG